MTASHSLMVCWRPNSGKEGPPAHERVMELDQQLLSVERGFPSALKTTFEPHRCVLTPPPRPGSIVDMDRLSTHIVLASAHIRLHRPFVIPRMGLSKAHLEWHRRRILYYGRKFPSSSLFFSKKTKYPLKIKPRLTFFASS